MRAPGRVSCWLMAIVACATAVSLLSVGPLVLVVHPSVKESLNRQGFEPKSSTPEQFAALIRADIAQNARLIKSIGLKAD